AARWQRVQASRRPRSRLVLSPPIPPRKSSCYQRFLKASDNQSEYCCPLPTSVLEDLELTPSPNLQLLGRLWRSPLKYRLVRSFLAAVRAPRAATPPLRRRPA